MNTKTGTAMGHLISKPLQWLSGDSWRNPKHPDFWLLVILVFGAGIRLWYLTKPLDWFISFFIADDCFYYLNTAYNIVHGFGSSFDAGLSQHNGFHPLFMVLLLIPASLGVGKAGLIYWSAGILTLSLLASIVLAYRLGALWGDRRMALCAPLFLALNIFFVKISFSGFESALALAFVLGLVYALASGRSGWVVGLLLGLTGLARIELLLLSVPTCLYLVRQHRWRDLGAAALISFVLVLPWFVWSYTNFHSLLPLSGVAKASAFQSDRLWMGFQVFCQHIPPLLMGLGLKSKLPPQLAFAVGVLVLYLVQKDWRTTGWVSILAPLMILLYGSFTNPNQVPQFVRYCIPAFVILGILLFARRMRPRLLVPILVAASVIFWSYDFYEWSARTRTLPTFVGLGQAEVPGILDKISGPDDRVGCFDSGSIGYFSAQPVINLDGLVNSDVINMLRPEEGGRWDHRYRRYFAEKGITILVGGTAFSWIRLFPDLDEWEVLHPPLTTTDGGEIVFLRIPDSAEPGS